MYCESRIQHIYGVYEERIVIGGQTCQGMPVGIPEDALSDMGESVSLKPSSMID